MSTRPVPTESAASIELARATESVAAAEVEALGPQVEGEAGYGRVHCHENEIAGLTASRGGKGEVDALRRGDSGKDDTAA